VTDDRDKALLLDFINWQDDHNDYSPGGIDAFLAARQPQGTPCATCGHACRLHETQAECVGAPGDARVCGCQDFRPVTPPAPQRFTGETDNASAPPCRKHNVRDCAYCHGGSSPEMESGNAPPAPQRFWRVFHMSWHHPFANGWAAWSTEDGWAWTMLPGGNHPTREQAEADGRASGLPEWPGEK
jgi:hypothetical protein